MSALEKPFITPEQYLEIERRAEFKSEYYAGQMFAMAGGTAPHNLIGGNIFALLWIHLRGRSCTTFNRDMKVQIRGTSLYSYPDVTVVCGEARFSDMRRDTLENPTVIVEVLSPSTEGCDRGEKFSLYRNLESLTDYLLVSQEVMRVEHYVRQPDNQWLLSESYGPEAAVRLDSLQCEIRLSDIYERVEVSPERNIPRMRRLQP